jgi:pyruvate dehydrogenase E2 component (dihydrolipoyllysine-residue acetyltransferase)
MAISVVMPALEMGQETGKLVSWLKKEGESVTKGEPLLEVETDKAVLDVEAAADGVLAAVTGEIGTDIPVGQVIAWIVAPGESAPASVAAVTSVAASVAKDARAAESISEQTAAPAGRVSPKARRMAKEAGIDIHTVRGSGQGGEILASDIQQLIDARIQPRVSEASAAQIATHLNGATQSNVPVLSSIGRLMAERTTQSWTTVPHFFLERQVDATALNVARAALGPAMEQAHGVKITHTDLLIALVGRTLAKHPRVNGSWVDDGIRLNPEVNIAIAMAVEDGVVAAVIRNADSASLGEIARQRRELTDRARAGRLRPTDLAGGTFTISNLGMFHIDSFQAIITPPQAAILAVGRIADRVVPVSGGIDVRPMVSLTLSSDHRVVDGAKAATFLHDLAEAMQEPDKWIA